MAPKTLEAGFAKADSRNMPKVNFFMLMNFSNEGLLAPEVRRWKEARSGREDYGEEAVGYVQVKREGRTCITKAEVTPETRVRDHNYKVICVINEEAMRIEKAECQDCAASQGCCKHVVAFLYWLLRQNDQPSVTEVTCYWKKSRLSKVGTTEKSIEVCTMGSSCIEKSVPIDKFQRFQAKCRAFMKEGSNFQLMSRQFEVTMNDSLHCLFLAYSSSVPSPHDSLTFLAYCTSKMTTEECVKLQQETAGQATSTLWHQMRLGRITASKFHDAAKCQTEGGSLVNIILGAKKIEDTKAMKWGRCLEPFVIDAVSKLYGTKVQPCGLMLSPAYPHLGASPDGLTKDWIIEVKCPETEESYPKYFSKDAMKPAPKYEAQMLLQMKMCKKSKGLYCVADPNFETNKKVEILEVSFNDDSFQLLETAATAFWKTCIFPKIRESNCNL